MSKVTQIISINGVKANTEGEIAPEDFIGGASLDIDGPTNIIGNTTLSGLKQPIVTRKVNCTAGNVTIKIVPDFAGQLFNIKRVNNGNNIITVTVNNGTTMDGLSSIDILSLGDNLQVHFISLTEGIIT